jgi:hypothetical protein
MTQMEVGWGGGGEALTSLSAMFWYKNFCMSARRHILVFQLYYVYVTEREIPIIWRRIVL